LPGLATFFILVFHLKDEKNIHSREEVKRLKKLKAKYSKF
jgi:hypothetical protein